MQTTVDFTKVKRVPARLTTSSYAVLGLLAIKPWTGYELTRQATRSLRFAWPKSERLLYAEPKKLVEHGLATAREEAVGRRLDFLMQELNREANTLASKSNDTETTKAAVELKVLIEQMREQVQNVE